MSTAHIQRQVEYIEAQLRQIRTELEMERARTGERPPSMSISQSWTVVPTGELQSMESAMDTLEHYMPSHFETAHWPSNASGTGGNIQSYLLMLIRSVRGKLAAFLQRKR